MKNRETGSELLSALKNDDVDAYELICKKYYPKLYTAVLSMVKDREITDKIITQIFVKLWDTRKEITCTCPEEALSGLYADHTYPYLKERVLKK
ncbi:RNA polymerase sigma factor [Sinomicrobium soli]|uniref:RNA polymerase sigma factor n=1 Tax=Sinomicrobium sp. N-1-3-6 TaxID=2219864 RepID=UPI0011BF52D1|nr:hypothetical protein [Sinomicrobium sp. N-1-3-6]